jgi:hypothetical protein
MASSASSTGVISPERTNSASPRPSYDAYSGNDMLSSFFRAISGQLSAVSFYSKELNADG